MTAVIQRPHRGSRISSFYPVKALPPLSALESAFQLQEYISLLIRLDVHDVEAIVSLPNSSMSASTSPPGDASEGVEGDKEAAGVDEACWIYEQLRRLAQDLSHPLITMLQQECTRASCPEMKAGEWQYLCVAHGNDGTMEHCCAIDYILHTLDSATALLNSPRAFPSRISIPPASNRHFASLARRLGRIFAHAYFHHREAFEQAEAESSLYARFLALTSKFDLVPQEFLVIPPRLTLSHSRGDENPEPPRLLGASLNPSYHDRFAENTSESEWERQTKSNAADISSHHLSVPAVPSVSESPRKVGRSRTDTMVFSEAISIAEELAKESEAENKSADEIDGTVIENTLGTPDTGSVLETTAPDAPEEEEAPAHEPETESHSPLRTTSDIADASGLRPLPEPLTDIEHPEELLPPTVVEPVQDDAPLEPPAITVELTTLDDDEQAIPAAEHPAEEPSTEVPSENPHEAESESQESPDVESAPSEHVPTEEDITTEGMATLVDEETSKVSEGSEEEPAVVESPDVPAHEQETPEPSETPQEESVAAETQS